MADPIPGKQVFTLSVKTAVSWAISTMGKVTPVADLNDPYPGYVSCIAQELYGGGVAVPDPVRAASSNLLLSRYKPQKSRPG